MVEAISIVEQKVRIGDLRDIMDLSETDRQKSIEQVAQNKSAARFVIHPFFYSDQEIDEDDEDECEEGLEGTFEGMILPVLRKAEKMKTPIIFGIQMFDEHKLARFLNDHLGYVPENFYYYSTIVGCSTPHIPGYYIGPGEKHEKVNVAWDRLSMILSGLGVKKVVVSGLESTLKHCDLKSFFEIMSAQPGDELWDDKQRKIRSNVYDGLVDFLWQRMKSGARNLSYNPDFCAGRACKYLSRYFQVGLSNYVCPDGHHEQMKIEYPNN